jgi:hypothetical protein
VLLPARDEHGCMTWHLQDLPTWESATRRCLLSGDMTAAHHRDRPQERRNEQARWGVPHPLAAALGGSDAVIEGSPTRVASSVPLRLDTAARPG